MKTLIIEKIEPKIIGELVTVGRILGETPDLLAIGQGEIPGTFNRAFQCRETIAANLVDSLAELIQKNAYQVILLSATTLGSEIAGRLGARLKAPVLSEVIEVKPDMTVKRPVYGGKAVAEYKIPEGHVILTIRRKYFEPALLEGTSAAEALTIENPSITLLSEDQIQTQGVRLEDAEIIVSGGRGMGDSGNFEILREMAGLLNAAVGASRGAVDEGWVPQTMQVGQTGNIVAPAVYFAVGISGASQHLAGIANAKCVVAVNKDEEANIFKRARFGIVSDYRNFIPVLIRALREEQ
ncbi:MAG: electron transfer flavoprotein subunit alpha/FixB family protein [Deltaproteobacteria bacterium]|nr:electron transfer flavoprotein subunit alpha/FixB family protein [Deltaproteobacteria bacterium]MBF0526350.1 electron transfer flavoprotein subunit alpha/FixB family protein [Deltaproteobacteria bacterium]